MTEHNPSAGSAARASGPISGSRRLRDYVEWHQAYEDPESELSKRLRRVQAEVTAALDRTSGPIRLLSVCAGDGRDVLDVLQTRPDRHRVTGNLLEIHPVLVNTAQRRISDLGLQHQIHATVTDAAFTDGYVGKVPADLVLLAGILGNISDSDVRQLINTAPAFCAPGATVIWTRDIREPDMGPDIRRWFSEAGFEESVVHEHIDGSRTRVGVHHYAGQPHPLGPPRRIFTFLR